MVRLSADQLVAIDAKRGDRSRPDEIRRLVDKGLESE
jgi:hypothetical protein